ncbi:dynein regulatory complex subunit 2-like isoform X2 [Bolinopsis microptera]|uniref:dynein regulatory complex subunit 2-like isoform X2 n=1 Tax=Bolinopsis microptera TaxID=2820187 RepID=UPI0030792F2F
MAKKRAGKKGKGKNTKHMTEEERVHFYETQLLAEEENRKKKEELLTQFLKDKLAKEEKANEFNKLKLQNQWRAIMREAKATELCKDIEILSQTFERIVDRKDAIIKSLSQDLAEAEEQYQLALRSHLQNIDQLVDNQGSRIASLHREYSEELEQLKHEYSTEREKMIKSHQFECNDLQDIMFAMEQEFNELKTEALHDFQSQKDEIKNKNLEEKHALRMQLEGAVEELWRQFQEALKQYNSTTEDRKKHFEELKAKDMKSAQEIELQMRKLQKIHDSINQQKAKMACNARDCEERNKMLKDEKESILVHFSQLKGQMNKFRENQRSKLTALTVLSSKTIKELKDKHQKGECILKLAEMCRKLETEEEKVLPFYASTLTEQEEKEIEAMVQQEPENDLANVMHEFEDLSSFWKRYNKVSLDKMSLDQARVQLTQENQQLRTLLKQYLDGISVSDEILSHNNPLFIVNNRSNLPMRIHVDPRQRHQVKTVVEAAHIVHNTI